MFVYIALMCTSAHERIDLGQTFDELMDFITNEKQSERSKFIALYPICIFFFFFFIYKLNAKDFAGNIA